jgi:hypothetical protein
MNDTIARRRALASSRRLLRITLVTLVALLTVAVPAGWWAAGAGGAGSAALGVGLIGVLFGGGILGLDRAARGRSPATGGLGAILAAFSLRLVVYALAFALVSRAAWVHGPSLALATAASLACMLAVELRAVAREPVEELETGAAGVQVGADDPDGPDDTDDTFTTSGS